MACNVDEFMSINITMNIEMSPKIATCSSHEMKKNLCGGQYN